MDANERNLIHDLFGKLGQTAQTGPARDPEAEALIHEAVSREPSAPYYMAQTILVQDHTLAAAKKRIEDLEAEVARLGTGAAPPAARGGGGFLGGLLGGGEALRADGSGASPWGGRRTSVPSAGYQGGYASAPPPAAPYGGPGYGAAAPSPYAAPSRGGGFLAGAAQTAVGVAGGMMLGSMMGNLFGGHHPFGGGWDMPTEVNNITENVFVEQPDAGNGIQDAADPGGAFDPGQDVGQDPGGWQDAGLDPSDAGFGSDDSYDV